MVGTTAIYRAQHLTFGDSMTYNLRIAIVSIALALAAVVAIIAAPRWEDVRVVAHTPSGAAASLNSPISITFSREVDQRSAERSFVLYPPVRGRFFWHNERTMGFLPMEPMQPQTNYRITIRSSLRDARGRANQAEISWPIHT
jgi:hypothetical protein